jgi:hypothetical protein
VSSTPSSEKEQRLHNCVQLCVFGTRDQLAEIREQLKRHRRETDLAIKRIDRLLEWLPRIEVAGDEPVRGSQTPDDESTHRPGIPDMWPDDLEEMVEKARRRREP